MHRLVLSLLFVPALAGCADDQRGVPVPGRDGAFKTAAVERAERRLFDGAPPVIAHPDQGMACIACHNQEGMAVDGLGFAPPSPHDETSGLSALSNCRQCHVFSRSTELLVANDFVGLRQGVPRSDLASPDQSSSGYVRPDLSRQNLSQQDLSHQDLSPSQRQAALAPPVVPHRIFMRENCQACHAGPAAREEIRTNHPERSHCQQCHIEQKTTDRFGL